MAQYKVPQDVEADDKLLGPFSFRQFIYLLIAAALVGIAIGLFRIFPFLAIIPAPFAIFLIILALPLRKDQPMEAYIAAVINFYFKPRKRTWEPGEPESTVIITAPKKVEDDRTNGLNQAEASRRLSFLADIVDSEGYAIKTMGRNQLSEEFNAEADAIEDIFETNENIKLGENLAARTTTNHNHLIEQLQSSEPQLTPQNTFSAPPFSAPNLPQMPSMAEVEDTPIETEQSKEPDNPFLIKPLPTEENNPTPLTNEDKTPPQPLEEVKEKTKKAPSQDLIDLANNKDFSIETIAQQANRINKKKEDGEVYISLR